MSRFPCCSRTVIVVVTALLAGAPLLAQAHAGAAAASAGAAFLHPFGGLDHLLAMLGVGALAATQAGRARWGLPAAFLLALTLAALRAAHGHALPAGETMIAGSVLGLGLLLAAEVRLAPAVATALCAAFAFGHGHAHGVELLHAPAPEGAVLGGFVAATALLHLVGYGLFARLHAAPRWRRGLGWATAGAGLVLVVATA